MEKLSTIGHKIRSKKNLLICIFATLISQLAITGGSAYYIKTNDILIKYDLIKYLTFKNFLFEGLLKLILISIIFGILIWLMKNQSIPFEIRQLFFMIYSGLIGFIVAFFLLFINNNLIKGGIRDTLIIFLAMFSVGMAVIAFDIDITPYVLIVFLFSLCILVLALVNFFLRSEKINIFITLALIFIYSAFIIFTTNNIIERYPNNTSKCIDGALDYYTELINIFINLLINRSRKKR